MDFEHLVVFNEFMKWLLISTSFTNLTGSLRILLTLMFGLQFSFMSAFWTSFLFYIATGTRLRLFVSIPQSKLCCYLSLINPISVLILFSVLIVMNGSWILPLCSTQLSFRILL